MNREPATLKVLARRFGIRLAVLRDLERAGRLRPVGTADDGQALHDPVATREEVGRLVVALGRVFEVRRP